MSVDVRRKLRDFGLCLPGANEEFSWEDSVLKVNRKIFVFLGPEDSDDMGVCMKLVDSHAEAMAVPGAKPAGYGLGRAGWVQIPLSTESPPVEVLCDWIEESYRLIAPSKMIAELDVS